jgi:uncharacterized protein (TIGR03086 family)
VNEIANRYRTRADDFERKVATVRPEQWTNQSPCEDWDARGVVRHIVIMHGAMLRPLDRERSPAPSVDDDPLGAFRSARADIEAVLADPSLAQIEDSSPAGPMTVERHIDQVVSVDLVLHGWDLARATGQDDTMDPRDVEHAWSVWSWVVDKMGKERLRVAGVIGREVKIPEGARPQDRLLSLVGRDPAWTPPRGD